MDDGRCPGRSLALEAVAVLYVHLRLGYFRQLSRFPELSELIRNLCLIESIAPT